jgi:hypothetical protein
MASKDKDTVFKILSKTMISGETKDNVVMVLFRTENGMVVYPQNKKSSNTFKKLWRLLA